MEEKELALELTKLDLANFIFNAKSEDKILDVRAFDVFKENLMTIKENRNLIR